MTHAARYESRIALAKDSNFGGVDSRINSGIYLVKLLNIRSTFFWFWRNSFCVRIRLSIANLLYYWRGCFVSLTKEKQEEVVIPVALSCSTVRQEFCLSLAIFGEFRPNTIGPHYLLFANFVTREPGTMWLRDLCKKIHFAAVSYAFFDTDKFRNFIEKLLYIKLGRRKSEESSKKHKNVRSRSEIPRREKPAHAECNPRTNSVPRNAPERNAQSTHSGATLGSVGAQKVSFSTGFFMFSKIFYRFWAISL